MRVFIAAASGGAVSIVAADFDLLLLTELTKSGLLEGIEAIAEAVLLVRVSVISRLRGPAALHLPAGVFYVL